MDFYTVLLRESRKELFTITEKLNHKEGAIQSKLQHKTSQLKKGKEKALEAFQQQMKGSERKMMYDIDDINKKIEALEQRRDKISRNYDELVVNHYNPLIKGLYEEGAISIEDLTLPISYHELLSKKSALECRIKLYETCVKENEEKEREKYKQMYEAKKRKEYEEMEAAKPRPVVAHEPKAVEPVSDTEAEAPRVPSVPVVKRQPKTIKLKKVIPEPTQEEINQVKAENRTQLERDWNARQKRMVRGEERIPDADDSFFTTEPLEFLEPIEVQCYGNQYSRLMRMRHSYMEDQEALAKSREQDEVRDAEEYRTRAIEKAKYGLS